MFASERAIGPVAPHMIALGRKVGSDVWIQVLSFLQGNRLKVLGLCSLVIILKSHRTTTHKQIFVPEHRD